MLSGRIVRASRLRPAAVAGWALATRRLPAIQQRSFFPPSINSKEVIEEKYPAPVELTDAEDPEMVGSLPIGRGRAREAELGDGTGAGS